MLQVGDAASKWKSPKNAYFFLFVYADPEAGEPSPAARLAKFVHFWKHVDLKPATVICLSAQWSSPARPRRWASTHVVEPLSGRGCCRFRVTGYRLQAPGRFAASAPTTCWHWLVHAVQRNAAQCSAAQPGAASVHVHTCINSTEHCSQPVPLGLRRMAAVPVLVLGTCVMPALPSHLTREVLGTCRL